MNTLTDMELINLVKYDDDEDAKTELFSRCRKKISFNIVKYRKIHWGKLNSFDVEDLIAECHLAIMEAVRLWDFEKCTSFATFSGFVIRTRVINYLENKTKHEENKVDSSVLNRVAAPVDIFRDLTIKVKNERDREIINMFLLGMRQGEIADEFKISKQRVHQIIKECIK